MNWDAIGAIGELLGATAVLVTLVYLALQVRHARNDLRRSIQQSRTTAFRELMLERTRNSELQNAIIKARKAFKPEMDSLEELQQAADLSENEMFVLGADNINFWLYRVDVIDNIDHLGVQQRKHFNQGIHPYYKVGFGGLWFNEYSELHPDLRAVQYVKEVQTESLT